MPGGVCAVLDYEVELMAEYVAEMAVRVVTPNATVTTSFKKFVSQILTSTRLPSTTILLGMNYLAKRINMTKQQQGSFTATDGQVWRLLTVALLLGSKFLDDNTFQNRSWSEVSGIAVSELNKLEYEWLSSINWHLYVNLEKSQDYTAWLDSWKEWLATKKRQQSQTVRERLAPVVPAIDTELSRYGRNGFNTFLQQQAAEFSYYENAHKNQAVAQPYRSRDMGWNYNAWQAPVTPPDSGYGTPEYNVSSATSTKSYDWHAQPSIAVPFNHHSTRYQGSSMQSGYSGYSRPNNYAAPYSYGQNTWEHNNSLAECNCGSCSAVKQPYSNHFVSHGYGQPVMG